MTQPADHADVPVGTLLPFDNDAVPDTFVPFDGRTLFSDDYPEVVLHLERAKPEVERLWEYMGGYRIDSTAWVTPNMDSNEAWRAMGLPDFERELILAIKVKRDVTSDAADSATS